MSLHKTTKDKIKAAIIFLTVWGLLFGMGKLSAEYPSEYWTALAWFIGYLSWWVFDYALRKGWSSNSTIDPSINIYE